MDYLYIFFALATFIAVVLLIEGLFITWNSARGPAARRIAHRLQVMSAGSHAGSKDYSIVKKRLLSEAPAMQQLLMVVPRIHRLDRALEQSGTKMNVAQFFSYSALWGLGTFVALLLLRIPVQAALVLGVGFTLFPAIYVLSKRRSRMERIEQQLPDALDLMGRAMRAGHALPSAIQMVSEEMADPIAEEFRIVFDEVNYGISMQEALKNLATRVPGTDIGYFVVAVLIQRETGGNLTELLHNIATIVRERLKLFGQIKVFSAEGRLSAWILGLLPVGLAAVLQISNPAFIGLLWKDETGHKALGVIAVLMFIGVIWMRKIIRIRV